MADDQKVADVPKVSRCPDVRRDIAMAHGLDLVETEQEAPAASTADRVIAVVSVKAPKIQTETLPGRRTPPITNWSAPVAVSAGIGGLPIVIWSPRLEGGEGHLAIALANNSTD
jgi:hypothetical protein